MGMETPGLNLHLGPEGKQFLIPRVYGVALGCGLPVATWFLTKSFWTSVEVYLAIFVPLYLIAHFWVWARHGKQALKDSRPVIELNSRAGTWRLGLFMGYSYAPLVLNGIYLVIAVLFSLP